MGSIVKKSLSIIVLCLFFGACSVLDNGFVNHNGQYVPKHPKFKLKNKQGNVIDGIDTLAIYKRAEVYYEGKLIFPKRNFSKNERYSFIFEMNQVNAFFKFYNKGRCLMLHIPVKDSLGAYRTLKESDLDPNNEHCSKDYYYSADGKNIQIERFVYGEGKGYYTISNYILNESKDTLTLEHEYLKTIYKKEAIPLNWKRYKVDW